MIRSQMIHARVEPSLKKNAEKIFRALGLTTSDVINALYAQVNLKQGLPFSLEIPNAKTRKALEESRTGKGKVFKTVEEFDRYFKI